MKSFKKISIICFLILSAFSFSQNKLPNDCVNYIQVCDNSTITLNPSGIGDIQEVRGRGCTSGENNSIWLKFTVQTSGTLGFDLIPTSTDINEDYDFWIFGPNVNCSDIGQSIRCSTTNPAASGARDNHTGMRDSEPAGDFFEGPGPSGDNYIKSLDVVAGESYFLVIDRPIGNSEFSLNWTGTATLQNPFHNVSFNKPPAIKICTQPYIFDFSTLTANILNGNTDYTVSYFEDFDTANYNQNSITSPKGISAKDYYYRVQSTKSECYIVDKIQVINTPINTLLGESFACIKVDKTGDFDLQKATVTDSKDIVSTEYYTNYDAATKTFSGLIANFTNYNSVPKTVYAKITNSQGCVAAANINLKFYPIPNIDTVKFNSTLCDTDFNGLYEPNFDEISKIIVNNSQDFDIYYFDNPSYNLPALPKNWTYQNPTRIYVLVASRNGCANATGFIDFKIGNKIAVNNVTQLVCDNDLDGKTEVVLTDFIPTGNTYLFYDSLAKAQQKVSGTELSASQNITQNKTFFVRAENSTLCPNIFELQITFSQPLKSDFLGDETICKNSTILVDAGTGFTNYVWSNGTSGSQTATYGKGDHYVDLYSNSCVYRQNFKISEAEDPTIKSILEDGNSITVNVIGGNKPYEYSLDLINWQSSNIFTGLKKGLQKVYVRGAEKCTPVSEEFLIINLINAITPNGDGKNDVLNYSDLRIKKDVKITIYNRYGQKVFSNQDQTNFNWDGKNNGRVVPTGTYWYVLEWIEPDTGTKVTFNGWVLLKN